jgi:hypothetical protein
MSKKQIMTELTESVEDVLKNLTAVKGEAYAKTVTYAHMGLHVGRLMIQIASAHDVPKDVQRLLMHQHAQLVDNGLSLIYDAQGMSDETVKEILDWAFKLNDKVEQAAENLSKES